MTDQKPKAAIVYDFDGTLAKGNLQENSFLPEIGMDKAEFWALVKEQAKEHDADNILVYMRLMLQKANEAELKVTRENLKKHGEEAPLFDGLSDGSWFNRLDDHVSNYDFDLEHYIVSSGTLEMILGCPIASYFKKIFASSFIFESDVAVWPGVAINYTSKTQFLFRINKGIDNVWDNEGVNAFMPDKTRPVPFERMIFIGDGDTDIPSMKMTTYQGGHAIAVYDSPRDDINVRKISRLVSDSRVDFVAPADFSENGQLDIIVRGILGRIARRRGYIPSEE